MTDHFYETVEAIGDCSGFVVDEGDLVAGAFVAERGRNLGAAISNAAIGVEHAGFYEAFCVKIAHRTFAVVDKSMIPERFHKSEACMRKKFSFVIGSIGAAENPEHKFYDSRTFHIFRKL